MNSFRIAMNELRRITAGRLPKAALVALALIPTLYGGLYLYANHDPYGRLDQIPAAVVIEDTGTTLPDGKPLRAGQDVGDELVSQHAFDWKRVTAAEAEAGVQDGTYDFALSVPLDFSSALGSSAAYRPRRAQLTMTTNDANSYLSTTIADKVTASVRAAIAEKVSARAANQLLLGIRDIRTSLVRATEGATRLSDGLSRAHSGARRLSAGAGRLRAGAGRLQSGANRLETGATTLSTGLGTLADRTRALPEKTRRLADGARQVSDGDARVAATGDRIASAAGRAQRAVGTARHDLIRTMDEQDLTQAQQRRILAVYDRLGRPVRDANTKVQEAARQLDRLATGADRVADGNRALADRVPALVGGISRARDGSARLATGAAALDAGAGRLGSGLDTLHAGIHDLVSGLGGLRNGADRLATGLQRGLDRIPVVDDSTRRQLAATIADPVAVTFASQATAGSYGAGLAPFFLALAAWIGGYVLFMLIRPISARATAANQSPLRVALGGWLTPALVGLVQVAVLLAVVGVGIRIVPANILGTLAFLMPVSGTFVAVVHALCAWFGKTGQFLGLVLMVLQLVTAGGTFPWQTIPQPLYAVHHTLPMSYAVDGLRQLMYGGLDTLVLRDVGVLLAWLVGALLMTSVAARRQRVWTMKRVKPELVM